MKCCTRQMETDGPDPEREECRLRWGGNLYVRWVVVVWIIVMMLEYFNAGLGFRTIIVIFK